VVPVVLARFVLKEVQQVILRGLPHLALLCFAPEWGVAHHGLDEGLEAAQSTPERLGTAM
jgi:hypothetical protein